MRNVRKPNVKGMTINSATSFVKNEANMQDNKIKNNAIFLSEFTFFRIRSAIIKKYELSFIAVATMSKPAKAAMVCQSTKSG